MMNTADLSLRHLLNLLEESNGPLELLRPDDLILQGRRATFALAH